MFRIYSPTSYFALLLVILCFCFCLPLLLLVLTDLVPLAHCRSVTEKPFGDDDGGWPLRWRKGLRNQIGNQNQNYYNRNQDQDCPAPRILITTTENGRLKAQRYKKGNLGNGNNKDENILKLSLTVNIPTALIRYEKPLNVRSGGHFSLITPLDNYSYQSYGNVNLRCVKVQYIMESIFNPSQMCFSLHFLSTKLESPQELPFKPIKKKQNKSKSQKPKQKKPSSSGLVKIVSKNLPFEFSPSFKAPPGNRNGNRNRSPLELVSLSVDAHRRSVLAPFPFPFPALIPSTTDNLSTQVMQRNVKMNEAKEIFFLQTQNVPQYKKMIEFLIPNNYAQNISVITSKSNVRHYPRKNGKSFFRQ